MRHSPHPDPVTLTAGPSKPKDLQFLNDAIRDVEDLLANGYEGKRIVIRCVVCDAPAKAMVKNTKLCSGYYGCDKCTQKGQWVDGRVTYPQVENLTLWTNEHDRVEMAVQDENDGFTVSPFMRLRLDMVRTFPIDYMHQACLGVMRKLLNAWVRVDRQVRMSAGQIREGSSKLKNLRPSIAKFFARKPRSLEEVDRWKDSLPFTPVK